MNNLFIFFKIAIKIAESALKRRVGRVSGNTGILFFFRPYRKRGTSYLEKSFCNSVLLYFGLF